MSQIKTLLHQVNAPEKIKAPSSLTHFEKEKKRFFNELTRFPLPASNPTPHRRSGSELA
jgi:hypothetical protein